MFDEGTTMARSADRSVGRFQQSDVTVLRFDELSLHIARTAALPFVSDVGFLNSVVSIVKLHAESTT